LTSLSRKEGAFIRFFKDLRDRAQRARWTRRRSGLDALACPLTLAGLLARSFAVKSPDDAAMSAKDAAGCRKAHGNLWFVAKNFHIPTT
jgi:hypothetical protein